MDSIDVVAEIRCLASFLDHQRDILRAAPELFTGSNVDLYLAMRKAFLTYNEISYEGIEQFYQQPPPSTLEAARGLRPDALLDHLENLSRKRELLRIQRRIEAVLRQTIVTDADLRDALHVRATTKSADSFIVGGIMDFASDLKRKKSGQYTFVSTGIGFLNQMLGGEWPRQGLTVVIGEGGAGKTALVCDSMLQMSRQYNTASYFQSLEMVKPRLVSRFIANMCSIDGMDLRAGTVTDEEFRRAEEATGELSGLPIYIDDTPGVSVEYIVEQIRSHKERFGISVAFVDYLQIIGSDAFNETNTSDLYGYYTTTLRNVGIECDISVVLLAQQNRAGSGMHSIFGSSRVSHAADVIIELSHAQKSSNPIRAVEVAVHKNRDGPIGSQTVAYNAKYLRFTNGE